MLLKHESRSDVQRFQVAQNLGFDYEVGVVVEADVPDADVSEVRTLPLLVDFGEDALSTTLPLAFQVRLPQEGEVFRVETHQVLVKKL